MLNPPILFLSFLIVVIFSNNTLGYAEETDATEDSQKPDRSITIQFDNDSFVEWLPGLKYAPGYIRDTDRNFSNGFRIDLQLNPNFGLFESFISDSFVQYSGFLMGQEIYTPEDIVEEEILPDQRPYAGYLFTEYYEAYYRESEYIRFGLQTGCIGPCALAGETQNKIHKGKRDANNEDTPPNANGWHHQISDEIVLQTNIKLQWVSMIDEEYFNLSPFVIANFGNIFTDIGLGINSRLGIFNRNPMLEDKGAYLVLNIMRKRVFYNATLQGGWFSRTFDNNENSDHTFVEVKRYVWNTDLLLSITPVEAFTFNIGLGFVGSEIDKENLKTSTSKKEQDDFNPRKGGASLEGDQYFIRIQAKVNF